VVDVNVLEVVEGGKCDGRTIVLWQQVGGSDLTKLPPTSRKSGDFEFVLSQIGEILDPFDSNNFEERHIEIFSHQ
jgi:hypothetical protein